MSPARTSSDPDPGDDHPATGERPVDDLGYGDALAELEGILAELEVDDADVDQLAAKVHRAAALIRSCRGRIDEARFEVEQVVAELDGSTSLAPEASDDDG